jgi:hypothetical protein
LACAVLFEVERRLQVVRDRRCHCKHEFGSGPPADPGRTDLLKPG